MRQLQQNWVAQLTGLLSMALNMYEKFLIRL
jgi:hypothetical protein